MKFLLLAAAIGAAQAAPTQPKLAAPTCAVGTLRVDADPTLPTMDACFFQNQAIGVPTCTTGRYVTVSGADYCTLLQR